MRAAGHVVFSRLVALGLLSCAKERPVNPQLLGRWQTGDGSLMLELRPDGGFVMAQPKVPGGQPARGRYAAVDDTHVRLSFGSGERSIEVISVSEQELVIQDWDGNVGMFTRMR
jgi:hypothetical protein